MRLAQRIVGIGDEVRSNPNAGTLSWLLHRVTGVALTGYLFVHMGVLSAAVQGRAAFDLRMAQVQSGLFKFLEIGLIAVVAFHLYNGVRVTLVDFALLTRAQRQLLWGVLALFLVTMSYVGYVFVARIVLGA